MRLELDTLKNNDSVSVIINCNSGTIVQFHDLKSFVEVLKQYFAIEKKEIKHYFTREEIEDFITNQEYLELEEIILGEIFDMRD